MAKLNVVEVAPATFVKVVPPLVLTCHWTVGVGLPLAAAVNVAVFPALTLWFVGLVVTTGAANAGNTVSVAVVVVAEPCEFVNTARYLLPVWAAVVTKLSVVEVAPATFVKVVPPLVLTCHWTVGVGLPLAATVNVAVFPALTLWFVGLVVIAGAANAGNTDSVAAVVVAEPCEFVNTARYLLPVWVAVVTKLNVVKVAPATLVKVVPPLVLTCH